MIGTTKTTRRREGRLDNTKVMTEYTFEGKMLKMLTKIKILTKV